MIEFQNVSDGKTFEGMNFRVETGALCKIITRCDHEKNIFLEMLLSVRKLDGGRILLAGQDIHSLKAEDLLDLFKRVGIVPGSGRLISNLRVWENITLPACYHSGNGPAEFEGKVAAFYMAMGFEEKGLKAYMGGTIARLPDNEKRLICIARAMLADPELIIYDSPFEGMEAKVAGRLGKVMLDFHNSRKGRASVFVSSHEEDLRFIGPCMTLRQKGKGFC